MRPGRSRLQMRVPFRGNHDRTVAQDNPAQLGASDRFAFDALTPYQRAWLGAQPTIASPMPSILACHGTPTHDETYLIEEVHGASLKRSNVEGIAHRLGDVGSKNIVLCAHSHRPDLVHMQNGVLVINPGSVGCPAYDDRSDCWPAASSGLLCRALRE